MCDKSNTYAADKQKFKAGNKEGIRFAPKNSNQLSIEDTMESDAETLDDEVDEQE